MYLGALVAFFVSSLIGDLLCSRTIVIMGLVINILSLGVVVFVNNFWIATVGLFFQGFGMFISYNLTYVFVTEMVVESRRQKYKVILAAMFSIGALYDVGLFYIIPDYKVVLMYFFGIPIVGLIVIFGLFLKDTPISLITKKTAEEAYKSFMYIAKMNNRKDIDLTLNDVK